MCAVTDCVLLTDCVLTASRFDASLTPPAPLCSQTSSETAAVPRRPPSVPSAVRPSAGRATGAPPATLLPLSSSTKFVTLSGGTDAVRGFSRRRTRIAARVVLGIPQKPRAMRVLFASNLCTGRPPFSGTSVVQIGGWSHDQNTERPARVPHGVIQKVNAMGDPWTSVHEVDKRARLECFLQAFPCDRESAVGPP